MTEDYYARGFKEGMITRVKMKNFLTFDECEGYPGAYLNVVIGPNGSGKSSMTHAICLACNGGTRDVGKSQPLIFVSLYLSVRSTDDLSRSSASACSNPFHLHQDVLRN